ncbi:aldehyde dehydrogenase (NAD+) [Fusarium agapanthi]|uniref:Aldehyde dehydrogenase (NAD+) n=1 Tax=Fusarium agapanthi TaxID=1803897 RepID=A0A9P5B8R2_9HYPO|nr:aldehyde dehydrogenase (NAD+) [Fusarium agapanthi]
MQSGRLIQSFKLLDESGNIPKDAKTTDGKTVNVKKLIEGFQTTLIQKFINNNTSKPGVATPDNPFVLGYFVSQEKAGLATVNPAAAKANLPTPEFIEAKSFGCKLSPSRSFCQGSLNYCMLTHRAKKPPYHKEDDSWETTQSIAKFVRDNCKQVNRPNELYFGSEVTNPTKELSQNNVYRVENKFNSPRRIIVRNVLDDPTESLKLEYGSSLEIKYENLYPLLDDDDDLKRRLKFTIGSYTKIKIKIYRRSVTSHAGDAFEMTGRFLFTGEIQGLWLHDGAFEGELTGLVKVGEGAAADDEKVFKGAPDDLANSLGATMIPPAGDIFMFKGMSCDENYDVFTTICYDTSTSGQVTTHASSDMSPQPPTKKK